MADYFINAITRRVVFSGSAGVGPYAFTFEVLDENDVAVYKDSTKLTLTTDYTVTVNLNGTGSVTLVSAATSANTITILGARDIERVTDFVTAGDLRAAAINEQLDALTIFDQQLAEEQKRTLMAPPYDPAHVDDGGTLNMTLPAAAVRANSFLLFDSAGNPGVQAAGAPGAPTSITRQQFSGDGSTVAFTLAADPGAAGNSLSVYISGVYQQRATYTVVGTALTFSAAPPLGTNNIEVVNYTVGAIGTTDASLVTYAQGSAGSVSRTVQNRLRETVSVKDFGAVGDGVTDDTAAIQAALDSVSTSGGTVFVPVGTYILSSELAITGQSIRLSGASRFKTLFKQTTLNAKVFNITAAFCDFEYFSIIYGGTPTAGATAIYCTGSYNQFEDFLIRNAHVGFHYKTGVAGKISDFEILDYESAGLIAESLNDLFVENFIINAGNNTRGALGGIRLIDKVEAFVCSNGDVLLGVYPLTSDATSYTIGNRPAYNNFTNVFFDSGAYGANIAKMVETDFVGCWFSNGRNVGAGNQPGAVIYTCDSLRFTNCRFFNCGSNGVVVASTANDITFTACKAESNSVTAGVGVAHGFNMDNNTQWQMVGCTATNGLYSGQQAYGIFINSSCDQFIIRDCNLVGNATGAISENSSASADKTIHGNIGYRTSNSGATTIASGTTSVVVNHGLPFTPSRNDILLTRGVTNAGSVDLYVDSTSITSTQFTIRTAPAPSSDITIVWQIRSKGA